MERTEWLEQRKKCIGASEAAAILGESDWASPYSVWASKVGDVDTATESERMYWGKVLEPPIADRFTEWAEENIAGFGGIWGDGETLYTHKDYPFIGASPDRFVCNHDGENIGLLEIKTTDGRNKADWTDEPPIAYQIQIQQQLFVTGLKQAWLAVLIGGNEFRVYEIEANERFQAVLVKQLSHFWNDYVLTGTPPPVDGSPATARAIALLHQNDTGAEIELEPDVWLPKLEQLERIRKAQKRLEDHESVILNELKSVISDSTFAHVGDKTVSYKTQTRKAHEVKESTFRVLRIGKRKNNQ